MRLRSLAALIAGALAVAVSSVHPVDAEPMPASAFIQDLTWLRDVWAAKEKSFSPETLARSAGLRRSTFCDVSRDPQLRSTRGAE